MGIGDVMQSVGAVGLRRELHSFQFQTVHHACEKGTRCDFFVINILELGRVYRVTLGRAVPCLAFGHEGDITTSPYLHKALGNTCIGVWCMLCRAPEKTEVLGVGVGLHLPTESAPKRRSAWDNPSNAPAQHALFPTRSPTTRFTLRRQVSQTGSFISATTVFRKKGAMGPTG